MTEYDLISKTALLKHLDMAIECKDCPRNADKELYKCVHNLTPQRCTCSEIAQICIRITDFEASADVQSVKHGYWEEVTDYGGWGDTHYRCSVCGEEWYLEDGKPKDNNMNFCPQCGAKMDAEPDEPWQSE